MNPCSPTARGTPLGQLFTSGDLEKLCNAAFETKQDDKGKQVPLTENAQQFADYVKLMAYCGCRRNDFSRSSAFIVSGTKEGGVSSSV